MSDSICLWSPKEESKAQCHIEHFRHTVNERHSLALDSYLDLHRWSVDYSEQFWSDLWDYAGITAFQKGHKVLENPTAMPGARWFPEARLNYAANLLHSDSNELAVLFQSENGDSQSLTHAELYQEVRAVAKGLRDLGVEKGDRIAGFMPNIPQTLVAMLACASIGAVWSSCSPDFGINGVRDRFGQIEPKVLFTADGYWYAGKQHDSTETISQLVPELKNLIAVVRVPYLNSDRQLTGRASELSIDYPQWIHSVEDKLQSTLIEFEPLPFDHPLYIMYSSGTTGKPKCIVHSAGGSLLQHVKEHLLHVNVQPADRVFFFTTCGWMMWNWLVSALACKATVLLYDGSPFHPDGNVLFDFAEVSKMTHFGTSAKFIDACNKAGLAPIKTHSMTHLRSVLSTGSPLVPESFDYVYDSIASDVCLSSMSGGTDILSCFVLGNPAGSVFRGELQCKGLGMDVQVFDDGGKVVEAGKKGELVCVKPFPSMPTGFFGDEDGSRYHAAYFDKFPNVWCHGDYVAETPNHGIVIYGRSDAVLNPGGVRIGTAEIYRQVESFDEVIEALVIGQQWQGDVRVVLFVRLQTEQVLTDDLQQRLKHHIREQTTPRHVPARIIQVSDIPRTRSGKIVELAVRKIVHGQSVDNIEALSNPDALRLYENLPELQS